MSPHRHPLVLIPGLLCDASVWLNQRAALEDIADIRVADHGLQDSLAGMARAILASAPPRFAIAGHSMGGRVALEVYRAAPERISGVALMDTGNHPLAAGEAGEREVAGRLALLETARREGMRAMATEWVQGMVHPDRLADAPLIEAILNMFASKTPGIYEAQTRALINRPDATPVMPTIRCPTLVLCGHEDSWSPVQRHLEMAAAIPGSTFVDIPDCGHMCTMERPEAVSAAMRTWFLSVLEAESPRNDDSISAPQVAARRTGQ
jgi:pimeloyl-ACP methyl ester carboxylesterase